MTTASNHRPAWDPTRRDAINQAVTFTDVVRQAAFDAAHIGITPDVIRVDHIGSRIGVAVQIGGRDRAAVDTLANLYGLADDTAPLSPNYTRAGHTVMAGDTVAVRVYCGRPLKVVA